MLAPWQQQFRAMVAPYEGIVPQLYLDSRGLITVGQGCQVSLAEVQTLLFYTPAGAPASQGDILRDYTRLQALAKKYTPDQLKARKAAFWITPDSPRLPSTEIDRLAEKRIMDMTAMLQRMFPHFDSFPDPAKIATLEMAWGTNNFALATTFPKWKQAVRNQDWRTAAKECAWVPAVGNQDYRNRVRQAQYLKAAQQVNVAGMVSA